MTSAPPSLERRSTLAIFDNSYARLLAALLLLLIGYILLVSYSVRSYTDLLYEARKDELVRLVRTGLETIQPVRGYQQTGALSIEEARLEVLDLIGKLSLRYQLGDNYFVLGTLAGEPLMVPLDSVHADRSRPDLLPVNWKEVPPEFITVATSPAGHGFVDYTYLVPPRFDQQRSVAYIVGIPECACYFGAGTYPGAIELANNTYIRNSLLLTGGLTILVFFAIFVALQPTAATYSTLLRLFGQVMRDPDTVPPVPLAGVRVGSEAWRLLSVFQDMLGRLQQSKQQIQHSEAALRETATRLRVLTNQVPAILWTIDPDLRFTSSQGAILANLGLTADQVRGLQLHEFFGTDDPAFLGLAAHRRALIGESVSFELDWGGRAFVSQVEPLYDTTGRITGAIGVAFDITERKQAEAELRQAYEMLEQRVAERTRELTSLLEVSRNVASTLELDPLLGLILDQLKQLVDYIGAALVVADDGELRIIGYRGPVSQDAALRVHFSTTDNPLWDALSRGEPAVIPDTQADTPLAALYHQSTASYTDMSFRDLRSCILVPLKLKDRVIGALTLHHRLPDVYSQRDVELALAIAGQAAIAIENARLYQQAQELAVLEERQRLARELHDSVSQGLYGIVLGTETARTLLTKDPQAVMEPLDYVFSLAQAGLAEMRALIFELRPESLETEGLVAAIDKQAAALRARYGIAVHTTLTTEPTLPLPAKEVLYRVAQEALNNTVKHAEASRVDILLECTGSGIVLEIRDDGVGFDPTGDFPGHLGLKSMRERATRIGGALTIDSAPGQGACIRAWLPTRSDTPHPEDPTVLAV